MINNHFLFSKQILTIILCLIFLNGCGKDNPSEDIHTLLINTSDRMNINLPDMVNQDMLLLETAYKDMEFSYFVSVLNYSIDDVNIDAFHEFMRPNLINDVCTSERHQKFINKDVSIRYVYSDEKQQEFTEITIHPADCKLAN